MITKFFQFNNKINESIKYDTMNNDVIFIPNNIVKIIKLIKKLNKDKIKDLDKLKSSDSLFNKYSESEKIYLNSKEQLLDIYKDVYEAIGGSPTFTKDGSVDYKKSVNYYDIKVDTEYYKNGIKGLFNYKIKFLPKTGIKVINMYKLDQILSKILKKGVFATIDRVEKTKSPLDNNDNNDKLNKKYNIIKNFIREYDVPVNNFVNKKTFLLKNYLYFYKIVENNMPDVDVIISPSSTSLFNSTFIDNIKNKFPNNSIYVDDNFFKKNIKNTTVDYEWLEKNKDDDFYSYDDNQILLLQKSIKTWMKKYDSNSEKIRLRDEITKQIDDIVNKESDKKRTYDGISNEIDEITKNKNGEARGRTSHKLLNLKQQLIIIKEIMNDISLIKKPLIDKKAEIQEWSWQIKNLGEKERMALQNFMELNTEVQTDDEKERFNNIYKRKNIINKLDDKKIIIFDDNISSGATLDDICKILISKGAKPENILCITLGVMEHTVFPHERIKWNEYIKKNKIPMYYEIDEKGNYIPIYKKKDE